MPVTHLTDVVVSRLAAPGIYYDKTTPAFGVRVGKNRKAWVITRGTDRQRITIGRYPAMSLADARKEAKKRLAEEQAPRTGITLAEAYEEYKEAIAGRKPRTQAEYKRLIDKYFIPKIGKKRLAELAYETVVGCVKEAAPSEAAHALVVCRAFLRWCVRPPRRYIPHSPLEGVEIRPAKKRKRILKPEELKAVWSAAGNQAYPYGTIVQLLVLTGQRRGEIANLRWPWINEKERTITLPEWVTKNKKEHTFPYNGMVAEILTTIPRRNTTDLLFPSKVSDERPLSGWSKYKRELEDGVAGWTLHDLRRTYRSTHGEIGTPREIAERLINHAAGVTTDVEEIYDRWHYLPQMRAAVDQFDRHVAELLRPAP
jgi:integrase